jgi:ribonuclease PH
VASITGAWVALALAVKQMQKYKAISKSPLTGVVAAISVGVLNGEPILDLCYEEDSRADVDANVVMTGDGRFVEFQATAEHQSFDDDQMASMTKLAKQGIAELIAIQQAAVEAA